MSDTYITLVSEELSFAESKKVAEKVKTFLWEQKIIQKNLSDCVLSASKGYAPAENYQKALAKSTLNFMNLKINGVRLITEKRVFDNGGNGLEEVNCPNCGTNNIETNWGDLLENWFSGVSFQKFKCKNCGTENLVTDFEFKPTWAFGNFGIVFWNWSTLSPNFIAELENIIGTKLKIVLGKL